MKLLSKLAALVAVPCVAIIGFAVPASATSVHITSGSGTSAHPYQFKVIKNKNGVVVYEIYRMYHTVVGDTFTITERTTMSNKTTEHWDGDHSVTRMYTKFLFGCSGQSLDVVVPCQKVSFYPQHYFNGSNKIVYPVSCASTGNSACHTTGWITRYGLTWTIDGGLWSSDYKFPKWQASISDLKVKINGHWIVHDKAAVMPWVQATLNT